MSKVQDVGVHSLDSVNLEVPDFDVAEKFYTAFGLEVRKAGDELHLHTVGNDHVWGILTKGPKKRLSHITFGAYAEDMPVFRERLEQAGVAPEVRGQSIWFTDPLGMRVEVRVAPKVMPDSKSPHSPVPFVVGDRGTYGRASVPKVHPTRLAHALFFTPDIKKSIDFYTSTLGLRISDFPGPIGFLHGMHGSDHHLLAFAESSKGVGHHHTSWDVGSFEEVGLGATQMEKAGYGERGWGLGRHVLGSNYFNYARDPWNSYVEYNFDIDYIPKGTVWQPMETGPEDMFHLWGPEPPEDFVTNYEQL